MKETYARFSRNHMDNNLLSYWKRLIQGTKKLARFGRSLWVPLCAVLLLLSAVTFAGAAETPDVEISNGVIRAMIHLPDPANGFYRGTRFDWSGIIGRLEYAGHNYYGPWFTKTDPTVHDFVFDGPDITAGPCSAATGPAEEYLSGDVALGYDEARPGGTFIKIGVGVLRKPDNGKYDSYRLYDIVDHGKWSVKPKPQSVEFVQRVTDSSSGYGYLYQKIVRLVPGQPRMVIEHKITNIGTHSIESSVYDHNFLVLDNLTTGPDFAITLPFEIQPKRPIRPAAAALGYVDKNKILYRKELQGREIFGVQIDGFGNASKDYDIIIENQHAGVGMRINGDRALESEELWSIRSVLAMEPYVHISITPGQSFRWKYNYLYYTLPRK